MGTHSFVRQISTGQFLRASTAQKTPEQFQDMLISVSVGNGIDKSDLETGTADSEVVTSAINEYEANIASYDVKRSREYPPMENYLDGVVKGDQAQIDKYIADCLAVKQRHPK